MNANDYRPVPVCEIIKRGIRQECPNCGEKTLFASAFKMHTVCSKCGMNFDKEDGFYAGYLAILYGLVAFGWIFPIAFLWLFKIIGDWPAAILAFLGAALGPFFLYKISRSIWLAGYYAVLPHELPANADTEYKTR